MRIVGNICDEGDGHHGDGDDEGDGHQIYEADVKFLVTGGKASLQDPR